MGLEGYFEVSDLGRVRAVERRVRFVDKKGIEQWRIKAPRVLRTQTINSGYLVVHMQANRKRFARTVHSVVAEAFIGPRPERYDVCHNNGIRTDCRAANLRYDTRSNNHKDRVGHGTIYDGATMAKLSPEAINLIRAAKNNSPEFVKNAALAFGVSPTCVRRVIRKESWKYV